MPRILLFLALAGTLLAAGPKPPMVQEGQLLFADSVIVFKTPDNQVPVGSTDKNDFYWPLNGLALAEVGANNSTITVTGANDFKLTLKANEPVPVFRTETDVDGSPVITWKLAK